MDFALSPTLQAYLDELDAFIAAEIKPLEEQDDNIRFFDHRREYARTDFENGGVPQPHFAATVKGLIPDLDEARRIRIAESAVLYHKFTLLPDVSARGSFRRQSGERAPRSHLTGFAGTSSWHE